MTTTYHSNRRALNLVLLCLLILPLGCATPPNAFQSVRTQESASLNTTGAMGILAGKGGVALRSIDGQTTVESWSGEQFVAPGKHDVGVFVWDGEIGATNALLETEARAQQRYRLEAYRGGAHFLIRLLNETTGTPQVEQQFKVLRGLAKKRAEPIGVAPVDTKAVYQPYAGADAATLSGFDTREKSWKQRELLVFLREIDGQFPPFGTGKIQMSPGRHTLGVHLSPAYADVFEYLAVEFLPKHEYRLSAFTDDRDSWLELENLTDQSTPIVRFETTPQPKERRGGAVPIIIPAK